MVTVHTQVMTMQKIFDMNVISSIQFMNFMKKLSGGSDIAVKENHTKEKESASQWAEEMLNPQQTAQQVYNNKIPISYQF